MAQNSLLETQSGDPVPADLVDTGFAWRIVGLLSIYRALICVVLLSVFYLTSSPPAVGAHDSKLFQLAAYIYLIFATIGAAGIRRERPHVVSQLQWMLLIDVFAITVIMHASGGIQSGIGNLLIVSVGATAFALPRRSAFVFAALSSITVLIEQLLSTFENLTSFSEFTPAGVLGATIFIIAAAAQPLARRLRESEALAARREVDLANLNELNQYIIQHLRESIVVIDENDHVRLMNDSAARLLGAPEKNSHQHLREISADLYRLTIAWRNDAAGLASSYGGMTSADGATVITPHFAPIGQSSPAPTTIFLEDTSQLAERVQQSKLAALGRLSASIAHEIRNPVGAISHASQLLSEAEGLATEDKRLTDIISNHCSRVSDIISSVLLFSKRDHTRPKKIDLNAWIKEFTDDYLLSARLDAAALKYRPCNGSLQVRVDPGHLQQVLWNLCENALRYGNNADVPGFTIATGRLSGNQRPYLDVLDRGPGIAEDKVEHIFEPFFTNAADGTGLGLFIARELCECNRATLAYEHRNGGGSRFRVVFSDPERWIV
ncbi:MAG: HAMP domain-containing histidine kinase [Gammaproteobacteria bacterium]|nr:HAMP domain-containing histidine kinase [Gammaproteobacteria bacterium]